MRASCLAALLALAVFSESPVHAQEGTSCPVPIGKQIEAIGAFAEMLPVFRHPRCMNCHGGMDIASARHPGADQLEPMANPLDVEQCQACHDGLPGWRQPHSSVFFTDKSDEELCLQMKKFEHTGDEFVEHIFNDHGDVQFIAAGFVGDRALGEGLQDYRLTIEKPPGTQAQLTAMARKWVDLLGAGYSASPECGCVVKLEGKFTYTDSMSAGDTIKVTGNLLWKPEEDGKRSAPTFGDVKSVFLRPTIRRCHGEREVQDPGHWWSRHMPGRRRKDVRSEPDDARCLAPHAARDCGRRTLQGDTGDPRHTGPIPEMGLRGDVYVSEHHG